MFQIDVILSIISTHPVLAYSAVFIISFLESLAVVGLFVPGTIIMFGVGAIVATGSMELYPVIAMAIAGAIVGDGISYWSGYHYHEQIKNMWPLSRYPSLLEKGEYFFKRHGGKSVLIGRFVGPVRPIIPIIAGMMRMKPVHFAIVNIFSAIGWAFAYILPGVIFGASLSVAGAISSRLAILILILVVTAWLFVWIVRKLIAFLNNQLPLWLEMLRKWAMKNSVSRQPSPIIKRFSAYFLEQREGEEWLLLFLLLLFIFGLWGFLAVLQDVTAKDPLIITDQIIYDFFQNLRTSWMDSFFTSITELGDTAVNVALFLTVLTVLLFSKTQRAALYWILAGAAGFISVFALKGLVHSPRPINLYQGTAAFGFPSGHTTMSVILLGFPALLIARRLQSTARWWVVFFTLIFIFTIAISRIYLGAHWFSDVLGGLFIGAGWLALLGLLYLDKPEINFPHKLLGFTILLTLLIAGLWHRSQNYQKDLSKYAIQRHYFTLPTKDWASGSWRKLPAWRIDFNGKKQEPFIIQSSLPPKKLTPFLLSQGWIKPKELNAKNILGIFSPETQLNKLLILPKFNEGQIDDLSMIRIIGKKRWILRFWPTHARQPNGSLYYVGTINIQSKISLSGLLTWAKNTNNFTKTITLFSKEFTLSSSFKSLQVKRTGSALRKKPLDEGDEQKNINWNNQLLLIGLKNTPIEYLHPSQIPQFSD